MIWPVEISVNVFPVEKLVKLILLLTSPKDGLLKKPSALMKVNNSPQVLGTMPNTNEH